MINILVKINSIAHIVMNLENGLEFDVVHVDNCGIYKMNMQYCCVKSILILKVFLLSNLTYTQYFLFFCQESIV